MKENLRVILSGGGTGGHIYPAISIADEIKKRYPNSEILFVGAKDRMEMVKVPDAGYNIEGLWISGINRKSILKNFTFPFKVVNSIYNSRKIIKKFKPDVVIGTGGFASGPLLKVASGMEIPTLIQEQNSFPGITNKVLGKSVDIICTAYDNLEKYFPLEKIVKTGNPIREDIKNLGNKKEEAMIYFDLDPAKQTLLVLGGSLGARSINRLMEVFGHIFKERDIQVIWQTGTLYYDEYKDKIGELVKPHAFLTRMDLAYAAADIIISRAGAGSVSELCLVGKPVLFIPSPNVAENHQAKNALAIANQKACMVLSEKDIQKDFEETILQLIENKEVQKELSKNISNLGLPNSTVSIVNEMERIIDLRNKKK